MKQCSGQEEVHSLYSVQGLVYVYEFTLPAHSAFLKYLTTVVLIRPVPTVVAEVTHSVGLHTHTVVAHEHILGTQLRLCEGNKQKKS